VRTICPHCGNPTDRPCIHPTPYLLLAAALLVAAVCSLGCRSSRPCPPPPAPEVRQVPVAVPVVPPEIVLHESPPPLEILTTPLLATADPVGWIVAAAAYIEELARSHAANVAEIEAANQARREAAEEAARIREELRREGIEIPDDWP